LGKLEESQKRLQGRVEDALLEKINSEDDCQCPVVSLEAIGYSPRLEVVTLIESAFHRADPEWQASALFANGTFI